MKKLVVYFDKNNSREVLLLMFFVNLLLLKLIITSQKVFVFIHPFLFFVLKASIAFLIFFFGVGYVYALFFISYKKPAAVLSSKGIWFYYFGFVSWAAIDQIAVYPIPGTPVMAIGILLKNDRPIFKQASLSGKISLFWSRLLGTPHITLSNVSVPYESIIAFARTFVQGQRSRP